MTELDEKEIKRKLELLELEGAEVSGDAEEDNEEGMTAPDELEKQFDLEGGAAAAEKVAAGEESDEEEEKEAKE